MHRYRVRGCEVRSENAAKPAESAGGWLLTWLRRLEPSLDGLDLGCGKLRYTVPLSNRINRVMAVGSQIQVDRVQTSFGCKCTVREYLPNVSVNATIEREWRRQRYDFILCSNVLSAIPDRRERASLISSAFERLKHGARSF
jgi:hypothetical protein